MGKKQINKQLKIFLARVKIKFMPEKVILFGSYAREEANEYSDIDILVVARIFKKMSEDERFSKLFRLVKDLYPDFHVYGFTPDEIKKASPLTTLFEAVKTGVNVLS